MSGMDVNMLACIRALAENRIQDAKKYAVCCCSNDTTKKNQPYTERYKKLLTSGPNEIEVPDNLKGLLRMEDSSHFPAERYYLGKQQTELLNIIKKGVAVALKLREYGIPYRNSNLIYGEPGTGKTEFAKYVAYTLGVPYAYVNFSFLIDSYMGNTAKNIKRVFDFCKGQKCVLMLDEIDCIGLKRGAGGNGGSDGEISRTTISLLQTLDELTDGQIVIAATNRYDLLDPALSRRFQNHSEFCIFDKEERTAMIEKYMNGIDPCFFKPEILSYADEPHTQADIASFLTSSIVDEIAKSVNVDETLEEFRMETQAIISEQSSKQLYRLY